MSESKNSSLNEEAAPYAKGLDFPDWSGQAPVRTHISKDQWLAYCRSNLSKIRQRPGYLEGRKQNGISVEFVL